MRTFLTLCAAGLLGFATIGCEANVEETDTPPAVTVEEGNTPAVDVEETEVQVEDDAAAPTIESEPAAEGEAGADTPVVEETE